MPAYALLLLPNVNRVYGRSAPDLVVSELEVLNRRVLDDRLTDLSGELIASVPYVTFTTADPLSPDDIRALSNVSSVHALFERHGTALEPIERRPLDRFDDDLLTIQRYAGKTNEAFTKLLVNVTFACSATSSVPMTEPRRRPRLLDPLCGRGTTLNQALMYGWDAAGVELDGRAVDAYEQFVKTWLQDKRLKHSSQTSKLRRDGKVVGRRVAIEIPATKEALKKGDAVRIDVVHDDTRHVDDHFPKRSFDLLVADLPYGVQHGNRSPDRLTRDPSELLRDSLASWLAVLAPGAALGLAWNTRVLKRVALADVLRDAGLLVLDEPPYSAFEHRVDSSIQRDVILAVKP
jgi:hypothetical protein